MSCQCSGLDILISHGKQLRVMWYIKWCLYAVMNWKDGMNTGRLKQTNLSTVGRRVTQRSKV